MSTFNVNAQTLSDAKSLGRVNDLLAQSLNRLSSGTRISDPAMDPVGVGSIAQLEAKNKRAQAATTNVQNAASYVQSSFGFISGINDTIQRMSELSQAATDPTKTAVDLSLYQTEFKELQDQLRQTIGGTTAEIGGTTGVTTPQGMFNGLVLFGANPTGISIAAGSTAGETINIPQTNLRTGDTLELFKQDASGNYTLSVTDANAAQKISDALSDVINKGSVLGAIDSRLQFAASSLTVESQNISAALTRIQDVDVARESTQLSKFNLLMQSGTAMLSQANQSPQAVLQLLKG